MSATVVERDSDECLHVAVRNALEACPLVETEDMTVDVRDGVVMLAGCVDGRDKVRIAEQVALSVSGVRAVVNELLVMPPLVVALDMALAARIDDAIQRHVRGEAIDGRTDASRQDVRVSVSHGHVTMRGTVDSLSQRLAVERLVRDIPGVVCVTASIETRNR